MPTEPFTKRLICVLLAAALLAPAAYFICGGAVFYFVYFCYDEDDYDSSRSRQLDIELTEEHGVDGMKKVFSIAGWSGVGVVSLWCLSVLVKNQTKDEDQSD
jgi:hypothetical protein